MGLIAWGALCAGIAVLAAIIGLRRGSAVERRLALLLPTLRASSRWRPVSDLDLEQSGIPRSQTELAAGKLLGLIAGAALGGLAGNALGSGAAGAFACACAGFLVPSIVVERRAAAHRRDALRRMAVLFERLEALAGAGRPVETALSAVARIPTGSPVLDAALRGAVEAYALGAPLFRSLVARAQAQGLDALAAFAVELERSRDLGQGSIAVVRGARDAARATRRTRALEASAKVEGKLMLTLVLCYLPALLSLVVVPLFLTLLSGLFG
jgi:tight adherence protein C